MPSKSAKKDWEIKQEYNLIYVAYTRAKKTLGFIDEKDFEKFNASNPNSIVTLKRIEAQVNQILNRTTKIIINEHNAENIINKAQKINKNIFTSTTVNLKNTINTRKVNSFVDLLKNKKIKKI